jgi:selenide,water dikinase
MSDAIPLLPGALDFARQEVVPGGTRRNLEAVGPAVEWHARVEPALRALLADAQTSGGLLIAVAAERVEALQQALAARGAPAWWVGRITEGPATIRIW